MINNQQHLTTLDLFRGLSGYGVAICHYYFYIFSIEIFQFYSIFFVEFFFVLSGFVLFPQLNKIYNNYKHTKIFYLRRWIRTLPPYFVALVCYSILFSKIDSDTLKYLFFIQNIKQDYLNYDYFYIAWSLSIEEFFYLLFPLFLIIFKNYKILNIIFLFIFIIYLIKIFYLLTENIDAEFFRIGTFLRLDSIAFGLIARILFTKINNNIFNFLSILAIMIILYSLSDLKNLNKLQLFLFILLIQLFSINMLVIFTNFNNIITSKYLVNFFTLISNQTYSVYLFHFIFIYLFSQNPLIINNSYSILFYLITIFIFSTFFYIFFEKNILKIRPSYID